MFSFPGLARTTLTVHQISMQKEAYFVRQILPDHYEVEVFPGYLHCKSQIGISMHVFSYNQEDDEHWQYIMQALRSHLGQRLQEVYHITCSYHTNFKIYIKSC